MTARIKSNGLSYVEGGFTLIELMISLVLGLLISAAVMQVYLINTKTATIQQSASEVQDGTIFTLQAIEDQVRIANLGNPIGSLTDTTAHGGIVLSKFNVNNSKQMMPGYLTLSAGQSGTSGTNGWTGISNTNIDSDQLTIQYKNITPNSMYDCEGTEIAAGSEDWVIERYFVRLNSKAKGSSSDVQDLVLACDSGRLKNDGTIIDFGGNGQAVAEGIDQFQVLLGVMSDINNLNYLPAKTYLELTDKPMITTIKLGVILRSTTPLVDNKDKKTFTILGKEQTLKSSAANYYRRSYESTILLRNARVIAVVGNKT